MTNEFLKSELNRKCLTSCYPKDFEFIHPITLDVIQGSRGSVCAVNPEYRYKSAQGDVERLIYDRCSIDDNTKMMLPNISESLLLQNTFDTDEFLKTVYNLHSFDDIIKWTVSNDNLSYNTVKRIHNCGWKVYGKSDLTLKVYDYYHNMFKNKWVKDCVKILERKYSLNIVLDKNTTLETLIISKYINIDNSINFINKFIHKNLKNWLDITNYYDKIRESCITNIIQLIKADFA
ncbi:MAG: hypothetical protein EOP34_05490 [Rickettsiales bacterium]|nr:MAG: hypothetical protein EOP34_05490 [Rickettsiales bacterium]